MLENISVEWNLTHWLYSITINKLDFMFPKQGETKPLDSVSGIRQKVQETN